MIPSATLRLFLVATLAANAPLSGVERDVASLRGAGPFKVVVDYRPNPGTPSYLEPALDALRDVATARLRDRGLPLVEVGVANLRITLRTGGDDHGLTMCGVEIDFILPRPEGDEEAASPTWQLHSWHAIDNRELANLAQTEIEKGLDELARDWSSVNPRTRP